MVANNWEHTRFTINHHRVQRVFPEIPRICFRTISSVESKNNNYKHTKRPHSSVCARLKESRVKTRHTKALSLQKSMAEIVDFIYNKSIN